MTNITFSEQDQTRWLYNGFDCMYTLEIAEVLESLISKSSDKLKEFYNFQMFEIAPALTAIMNQGIRIDLEKKEELHKQLTILLKEVEDKLEYLIGEPFNPKSQPQLKAVFKDLCGITPIINKKTKSESFASITMFEYRNLYPEYKALIDLILEYRSIGVFLRTFVSAEVDEDGKMRTSYNVAGTKTYRLSSRKNAFGRGANLANIPSKGKIDLKYSLASIEETEEEEEGFVTGEYEGITKLPNCKEFFIPDEGYNFWNADYSGADAMIVAYSSDCNWLIDFFKNSKLKLYQYIASHYYQREVSTTEKAYKTFKQYIHGCVTSTHEVLTPNGWVFIDKLEKNTPILTFNKGELEFEIPSKITKELYEGNLISLKGKINIIGTPNHRQLVWDTRTNSYKEYTLEDLPKLSNLRIINNGSFVGGNLTEDSNLIKFIVAAQADGSWKNFKTNRMGFRFTKARKINRLLKLLTELNWEYKSSITNEVTYIECIVNARVKDYLDSTKTFNITSLLQLDKNISKIFIDELAHWDGSYNKKLSISYSSINETNAKVVQTLGSLNNYQVSLNISNRLGKQPLYRLILAKSNGNSTRLLDKQVLKHKDYVYCVTVSSSYFVIKLNNKIMVTGNSHYGMMEAKAAANANMPLNEAKKLREWYFKLCPEIPDWHKRIASDIKSKGYVENIFGARGWFLNKESPTILNQAYAYIPQSSIAILVNKGLCNIFYKEKKEDIAVLMQVHDALAGQYRRSLGDKEAEKRICNHMEIELPYKDRLVIPVDFSFSEKSYGDCR